MPELRHVDAQVLDLVHVSGTPNFLQQLAVGDNLSGMVDQHRQQFIFNWGKVYLLIVHEHLTFGHIDPQVIENKDRLLLAGNSSRRMAQGDAYPCQELSCVERLSQVVISSGIKRLDLVQFLLPC